MAEPDLDLSESAIESGRAGDCERRCIAALRADGDLRTLIGDAARVIPATDDAEPTPVLLVVEVIATGSTMMASVEQVTCTVETAPLISPAAYAEADPLYLMTVRDRAMTVLREGIGPGWTYIGATDLVSFTKPRTADDINALVQYSGRVQFRVNITRSSGSP